MKVYNVTLVFHQDQPKMLMCHRLHDPYKGKYNLVGGKVEAGETPLAAAYRELEEETSLSPADIVLYPLMTSQYHQSRIELQIFFGKLRHVVDVHGNENPLIWMGLDEDFFNCDKFAGDGNIGHMLAEVGYCRELLLAKE